VEWSERLESTDLVHDRLIDQDGLDETGAAVDDPVRHGHEGRAVHRIQRSDADRRLVRRDDVELEARRARVDEEDGARSAQKGQVQPLTSG
jgi:hypothetical protein